MKTITLEDLTQEQFDEQSEALIDLIRTKYPRLDLRKGTVLRDLLINADSVVGAMFSAQADEQRNCASLLRLQERSDAGEEIDVDDVNRILSNFNMKSTSGSNATGIVRVFVSSPRTYSILEGFVFTTIDGLSFSSTMDVEAAEKPAGSQTKLYSGASNYWFLVPVECVSVGSAGNIEQGTALDPQSTIFNFVAASAYKTFSGGSDIEALDKTVARIKPSLSLRGLTNKDAVEAQLRDRFDDGEHPIVALSVCGYGNEAQRRDKHNAFGVAVGGRSDIYVRNFTELPTVALTLSGKRNEDGSYSIDVPASAAPGMYCVHRVSDPESDALASYEHSERWYADGVDGTWHDIDVSSDPHETFNTVFRGVKITVSNTEFEDDEAVFRVELVVQPEISDLQSYVDDESVRNTGSDFLVRGPVIVQVSVVAVARHEYSVPFDTDLAVTRICEYINTSGFTGRLTRSEIASILRNLGAKSVDLFNENQMLYGYGYDAFGNRFELSGDALDVDNVKTASGMVTKDTCVFVVEPANVQIRTITAQ